MKRTIRCIAVLCVAIIAFVGCEETSSQNNRPDYTQLNLPDGAIARLGKGRIADVAFSPNGQILAVATSVGVWLYDSRTYEELALLNVPTAWCISFSPDGEMLAIVGRSGSMGLELWSISNQKKIAALRTPSAIHSVLFSLDGEILAGGSHDGKVSLWSISGREEIATFKAHDARGIVSLSS